MILNMVIFQAHRVKQRMASSDRKSRIPSGITSSAFSWRTYISGREACASKRSELLEIPPPPELGTGEFAARRKALQGSLLTSPDKHVPEAHVRLAEAEALALSGAPNVESEVLLNEGTLAIDEHDFEAGRRFLLRGLAWLALITSLGLKSRSRAVLD